jgi:hypothetical protein
MKTNKLLAILACLMFIPLGQAFDEQSENIDVVAVEKAITDDNISLQDCRKWYSVYKGAYIYVKDYKAAGCNDFGDFFDKMIFVRDGVNPSKGNPNFIKATSLSKFQEAEYTDETKSDLAESLFNISEGIRKSIEKKNAGI